MRPKCGETGAEREEEKRGEGMKEIGGREGPKRSSPELRTGEIRYGGSSGKERGRRKEEGGRKKGTEFFHF